LLAADHFVVQSHGMETNQAAENLQVIRTLMERSAIYRRALAPIMTFCGVIGIVAGIAGWQLKITSDQGFVLFWSGVAAAALVGSLLLVRRQALKDKELFWSPPTRRIAQALLPSLAIGCFTASVIFWGVPAHDPWTQNILVTVWAWLYGCALHSAGFFVSRGFQRLGWIYAAAGCAQFGFLMGWLGVPLPAHLLMAGIFGGLHLISGIYLYFTEPRKNVA
jgi:hypothetical protein